MLCTSVIAFQFRLYSLRLKAQVSIWINTLFRFESLSYPSGHLYQRYKVEYRLPPLFWHLLILIFSTLLFLNGLFLLPLGTFTCSALDMRQGISVIERRQFSLLGFAVITLIYRFILLPFFCPLSIPRLCFRKYFLRLLFPHLFRRFL